MTLIIFNFFLTFWKRLQKAKVSQAKKIVNTYKSSKTSISFEFSSKLNDHSSIKTVIYNDQIGTLEILQTKQAERFRQMSSNLKFSFKELDGVIENCSCEKEGFLTLFTPELKSKCEELYTDKSDYLFYSIAYLLVFQNYVDDAIKKIRFVNPIGTSPKRFYFQEDTKATYKLIDIEKFVNVIGDKNLNEKEYEERLVLLNQTIKSFGIADEVSVIKDKQLPVIALNVKTKDFWSNITDVGYGVSLQIPILFQALLSENYTKGGQTILIEQPEVHLHPTLQAKFIETLLSIGSKNSYFIETHSEHIIRKLQVLIKNKEFNLSAKDVTIHYFKREELKFNISEHKIDENGRLTPVFPDGFFDTSYSLVKQLL